MHMNIFSAQISGKRNVTEMIHIVCSKDKTKQEKEIKATVPQKVISMYVSHTHTHTQKKNTNVEIHEHTFVHTRIHAHNTLL